MSKVQAILLFQIVLLAACFFAVGEWAVNFPYPSPLIKPLLSPKLRWPDKQIAEAVQNETFESDFSKFFYRDPERTVPPGPDLVAPADGVVQLMTFRDNISFIVIGLSFWDVHVVRAPIAGEVIDVESEGQYYPKNPTRTDRDVSFFIRGKAAPVQQIVTLQSALGIVRVRLITSYWASRIKVWVHPGQHIDKGQRLGRMLLGSTVVTELPGKTSFAVGPMQRVTAGETIILRQGTTR